MNPPTRRGCVFSANRVERKLGTPNTRSWTSKESESVEDKPTPKPSAPFVDFLNVTRKHARFHISTTSCQENIVGVPIDTQDSGSDRFFEVLRNPPVAFLIKRTNCDGPGPKMSRTVLLDRSEK